VGGDVVRRLHGVGYRAWKLRWDVLVQASAERGVDELDASADAQSRLAEVQNAFAEDESLHPVPYIADFAAAVAFGFAVDGGVHVLAAGEEESVNEGGRPFQRGLGIGQRQDQRYRAGLLDAAHVAGQHPYTVLLFIPKGHDPYHRPFHSIIRSISIGIRIVNP